MLGSCQFAAANATVRAGVANLLPPSRWSALVGAPSVEAVVESLTQWEPYQEATLRGGRVHAEGLERRLREYFARAVRGAYKFLIGSVRDFVQWRWCRFEVNNLLILLRGVHRGVSGGRIRSLMVSLPAASELDWQALSSVSSVGSLAERLSRDSHGAFFGRALQDALKEYERTGLVFALETALNLAYYRALRRRMRRLGGRDARAARTLIGTLIDGQTVISAYRYRTYFSFDPEQILSHTLSRGAKVGPETVQRIASGAPLPETAQAVWGQAMPGLARLADMTLREGLVAFELMFRRCLHHFARRALQKTPLSLSGILAYDRLLEDEVDDLVSIVESARVGMDPQQRRQHLIGDRGHA